MNTMTPQEKSRIFFEELKPYDIYPTSNKTQEEILRALDNKIGFNKEFDRHLSDQLFEQIGQYDNSHYSMEDFYLVWSKAEEILRQKIDSSEKIIEDDIESREEVVRKQEMVNKAERLNSNGIMENSTLTVTLEEGEDFRIDGRPVRAYIVFTCEDQKHKSSISSNTDHYSWRQDFQFSIKTGRGKLLIEMFDGNHENYGDSAGLFFEIELANLYDQQHTEEKITQMTHNRQYTSTRLLIGLQWIHSQVKYLNNVIQKWDLRINEEKENLESYILDLNTQYEPWDGFKNLTVRNHNAKYNTYDPVLQSLDVYRFPEEEQKLLPPTKHSELALKILFWTMFGYFVVATMDCYYRCVFLDVTLSMIYMASALLNEPPFIKKTCYACIGGVVFSIVLDIIWLCYYMDPWWNTAYVDANSLEGLRQYIIVMAFILIFVKVFVIGLLAFLSLHLSTEVYGHQRDIVLPKQLALPDNFETLNAWNRN